MKKVQVGQSIYFRNGTSKIVDRVGNTYFYCGKEKFEIETLSRVSNYSQNGCRVFLSKDDLDSDTEYDRLRKSISEMYTVSDASYIIQRYDFKDRFTIEELQMIESKLKEVDEFILSKGRTVK